MNKIKVTSVLSTDNFQAPFEHGWKRELVYSSNDPKKAEVSYFSPAGNKIRTKHEILQDLDDCLDINMFSFAKRSLGFDGETVRVASTKGYRKDCNKPASSGSGVPITGAQSNDLAEDRMVDTSYQQLTRLPIDSIQIGCQSEEQSMSASMDEIKNIKAIISRGTSKGIATKNYIFLVEISIRCLVSVTLE